MTLVATLISPTPALDDAALGRARAVLPGAPSASEWHDPGSAADIFFSAGGENDNRAIAQRIREALGNQAVDVVVQNKVGRSKRLFVADMDSTMISQECIDELADLVGQKAHVAAITERAMRGELAFAPALRERVALLKGLPARVIDDVLAQRIVLTPGGRTLVATMRANGAHTCLVSGGFTAFADKIAQRIGFDEASANQLLIDANGKLLGEVVEPILGREAKLATLLALRGRLGLAVEDTLAVGDGANDLDMIRAAGLGIAFHAKPAVAAAAAARIDHCDLTAVLFVQGYRRDQFVE
jgi:phosphoserine phosphatase